MARGGVRTLISYSVRPFRAKSSRSSASRIEPEFDLSRRLKMRTRSSSVANLGIVLCCRAESATRHQLLFRRAVYLRQSNQRARGSLTGGLNDASMEGTTILSNATALLNLRSKENDSTRLDERGSLYPPSFALMASTRRPIVCPLFQVFYACVLCALAFDFPADNRAYIRVQIFIFGVCKGVL